MKAYLYYVGLALLFTAPVITGLYLAHTALGCIRELEGYVSLIRFIDSEITGRMAKQEEIFKSFKCPYLEKCGFLKALRSSPIDESSALNHALRRFEGKSLVPSEVYRALYQVGDILGKTSVSHLSEVCTLCLGRLTSILEPLREETAKKARVYRVLGFSAGAAAVILFI